MYLFYRREMCFYLFCCTNIKLQWKPINISLFHIVLYYITAVLLHHSTSASQLHTYWL